jgi:ATP-binding cassette subfamily F protein 3
MEPLRRRVRETEARVATLTKDVAALETQLATPATYGTHNPELSELLRRQAELRTALAAAEIDWLAASEALEAAS